MNGRREEEECTTLSRVSDIAPEVGTVVGKSKYLSPGIREQLPPEAVGCAAWRDLCVLD